ncbi:Flp pilus assembly protein CpaB [Acidocella sp.]|uniref:Flp pilus assembly protein CpaB n=1 Tax=Acidocella sp. TaxID=50710 RepID=UPI00260FCD99|nr:Flp pilus assembly protein CpaB [Acidocella sp.]
MVFRLGIFAVLIAALGAVVVFGFTIMKQGHKAPVVVAPQTEQVLVAAMPLSGGALIQPNNIGSTTMPVASVPVDAMKDTPQNRSSLTGAMVKARLAQGAMLTNNSVILPGDHGFLAAVLKPGMRAVTVAVDNVTDADGLIWPGDRVDVLLTQNIAGAPDAKKIAAEVVLSDVRVIATGSELIKNSGSNTSNGSTATPVSTVTLEVTQEQAARCLVAVNLGKLSLIVHSARNSKSANKTPPLPVWAGQVSPALSAAQPTEQPVTTVKVISAGNSGEFKF